MKGISYFFPAIGSKFNSCHDNLGQFCSTGGGFIWNGGSPYEEDKFEENAKILGATVYYDKDIDRDYIVLPQSVILYHGTKPNNVDSIKKEGIKIIPRTGQVDGVYLAGKETAEGWRGSTLLKVTLPKGERLYADVQPNATFIRRNIPPSWIE